jgi:hypothetical protein
MVCDSIDFDFSDFHPNGLTGRFALDTPFLFWPWPNLCLIRCATRPRHDARLAAKQS